jgi:hypothetical protein
LIDVGTALAGGWLMDASLGDGGGLEASADDEVADD